MQVNPKEDVLPLTALVPETAAVPITLYDSSAALCVAVVERAGAHLLPMEWDVPGVYILVDPIEADGTWSAYVGKAPGGLRTRLQQHLKHKDYWRRAVLVRRDTTHGFNSAQVGWLEGRLYNLLDAAEFASLHNGNKPSDETLPAYERTMLEASILPITRVLRLIGYTVASAGESPTPGNLPQTKSYFGVTIADLIEAGLLAPGTDLTSVNGAWPAEAKVTADATITWNGQSYSTPSAAAAAVKGGAVNGWDFWAISTETSKTPLAVLRRQLQEANTLIPAQN
ncbi:MAG: hypothetical protein M0020_09910 [Actinomycetota bacterium]|nr:hypothetical protein [Actinomycetota bacterium]